MECGTNSLPSRIPTLSGIYLPGGDHDSPAFLAHLNHIPNFIDPRNALAGPSSTRVAILIVWKPATTLAHVRYDFLPYAVFHLGTGYAIFRTDFAACETYITQTHSPLVLADAIIN